jgi:hypothetical protein
VVPPGVVPPEVVPLGGKPEALYPVVPPPVGGGVVDTLLAAGPRETVRPTEEPLKTTPERALTTRPAATVVEYT